MSRLSVVDNDPGHLFPLFRDRLLLALGQAVVETRGKHGCAGFVLFEGYRSAERQKWLFAQGRSRPGPIVTWTLHSRHMSAAAADCYPTDSLGRIIWEPHISIWEQWGHCCRSHALHWGGDGLPHKGGVVDLPHVQLSDADYWQTLAARVSFVASLRSHEKEGAA